MAFLDTDHQRAAFLLLLLGAALLFALTPFAVGLLGILVLYVIFQPVQSRLEIRFGRRLSAVLVVILAVLVIVLPGIAFAGLIVSQAQEIATGVVQSPILTHLRTLRIAGMGVGPHLAELGSNVATWLGNSAFGFIGTATLLALNLMIALFGLYYLLQHPKETWNALSPYVPFSKQTKEKLRKRFRDVTTSTVIGTGVTSLLQGALIGLAFGVCGIPNVLFWSVVAGVFSILPVVGATLVWAPACLALVLDHRYGAAAGLGAWSIVTLGVVDHVIRPMVFRRWASIHPLTTLVGALAGVPFFGILGLLIGPLAISYFMELSGLYREEYLELLGEPVVAPAIA